MAQKIEILNLHQISQSDVLFFLTHGKGKARFEKKVSPKVLLVSVSPRMMSLKVFFLSFKGFSLYLR